MATLGEELRREREQRSITLKDIAEKTKINLRHLEALESGSYEHLLEPFFIKGILRTYAKVLGLPEDRFLARYLEEVRPAVEAEVRPKWPAPDIRPDKRKRAPRRKLRRAVAGGLALILLILLTAAYILFLRPMRNNTPVVAAPSRAIPTVVSAPVELPPVLDAGPTDMGTDLKLELTFTAETWIHIAADGMVQFDGMKHPGDKAVCRARRELVLQTGNAGGFAFTLNGRPGRPLGAPGAVLTNVRINRETLASFLAGPPVKSPAGTRDR
jgi:cytoskeletal protein RodZ